MFSKEFLKDTLERALATAAQAAIAILSVDGLELMSVDLRALAASVGLAFILSVLKSLIAFKTGTKGTASLVK